jgi:hypothetical protein
MGSLAIPAPVGGWNARDAIDKMPATDAVSMVNMIPRGTSCEQRRGSTRLATGLGGSVDTLAAWTSKSTSKFSNKLIAGANGNLYNVTSGTAVSLAAGFINNQWQTTSFNNRLIFTNGFDTPQVYDGTTVTAIVATGPTLTTLWGVNTFKGRAYYWQRGAQSFWYAAAGAYQGTLTEFDLSGQVQNGGFLMMMLTWTLDSGKGVDDLAVFVFSTGEVLVYAGDDPGNAAAWALQGRFIIGAPISIRGHAQIGGTEIIITRDGYIDISAALRDGRYSEESAYSAKINPEVKKATAFAGNGFGWEATLFPAEQVFIVNVPTSGATVQHVRSTADGGWCSFAGWDARTFAVLNDVLFYGTPGGEVYRAFASTSDGETLLAIGAPVEVDVIQAFNPLGSRERGKQVTSANVVTNYQYPGYIALDILPDFSLIRRSTVTAGPFVPGTIDLSVTQPVRNGWRNATSSGYTHAISIRFKTLQQIVNWYSTTLVFKNAGVISQ